MTTTPRMTSAPPETFAESSRTRARNLFRSKSLESVEKYTPALRLRTRSFRQGCWGDHSHSFRSPGCGDFNSISHRMDQGPQTAMPRHFEISQGHPVSFRAERQACSIGSPTIVPSQEYLPSVGQATRFASGSASCTTDTISYVEYML
jgi:hypothetical protein